MNGLNTKILGILLALAVGTVCIAGCQFERETSTSHRDHDVTWTDTIEGERVTRVIDTVPKRAVSMSQATTEMMLTLGLADQMVGTAFLEEPIYEPVQAQYNRVPVLAAKWPSYEKLMSVEPDFVAGWETDFTKRGIPADKIEARHIPIFIPDSMQDPDADLDTLFNDMLKLGDIFDKSSNAQTWVEGQKKKLADVQGRINVQDRKRIFIFDSDGGEPFTVFSGYTDNIFKLIGADNVMSGQLPGKTWAKASWEQVVAANPDYIIVVEYDNSARNGDSFETRVQKIKDNPQLQSINAVKNNHFIKVKLSEITPGVRTVEALERLATLIHGQ